MTKLASAAIAAVLVGTMAIPAPVAAQSFSVQYGQQDRFIGDRCDRNSRLRGCDDWRRNHHRWDRDDYRRWYGWNQHSIGGSIAAGIFGFAVGAAIANSANGGWDRGSDRAWSTHVARCEARYRSYDEETDMFKGYDGDWHRCRL